MAEPTGGETAPRRLVLGLGNPGERYAETRHNLGFRVIDEIARRRGIALDRHDCNSHLGWDEEIALAAPQTYMNRSGFAVRCLAELYDYRPEDLLVVYDEVHLPLGSLRLRPKGSPAGHRGMESVLENLGTDSVARLRLGIVGSSGPPAGGDELVDYVLQPFAGDERPQVEAMIRRAADACEVWTREGTERAMQRFNGPPPDEPPPDQPS